MQLFGYAFESQSVVFSLLIISFLPLLSYLGWKINSTKLLSNSQFLPSDFLFTTLDSADPRIRQRAARLLIHDLTETDEEKKNTKLSHHLKYKDYSFAEKLNNVLNFTSKFKRGYTMQAIYEKAYRVSLHSAFHPSESFISSLYHTPTISDSMLFPNDVLPEASRQSVSFIAEENDITASSSTDIHCCPFFTYTSYSHTTSCQSRCAESLLHCGFHFPPWGCVCKQGSKGPWLTPSIFRPCLFVGNLLSIHGEEYTRDEVLSTFDNQRYDCFDLLTIYPSNVECLRGFQRANVHLMITQSALRNELLPSYKSILAEIVELRNPKSSEGLQKNQLTSSDFLHQTLN